MVFWPFTREFLSSQVEPNWAKPGKRARVNEVLETLGMDKLFQIHSIWEKDDTTEDLRTHMDDTDDLLEEEEDDDDNDERNT